MASNIVFDFGAVLFTWRPDLLVQQVFPSEATTPAAARQLASDIFHHADWLAFDGGMLELATVVERTAQRLQLAHGSLSGLVHGIPEHLVPIAETVALLERLVRRREQQHDIHLYYLSNMPAPYARVLEQRHPFLAWFEGGVFSGDAKLVKPQPEIFQLLQTRYGLNAEETIFIDDLPANVEAARTRGWQAIHFGSAAQVDADLAVALSC